MARAKKPPIVRINPFESEGVVILSTKECTVTSTTNMFGLKVGEQYKCLRKCFVKTHNRIFEIVTSDGEVKCVGDCWFEVIKD